MTLTMLKSFAASIAVAGTILTAAGVLAYQSGPVQPGRAQTAVPKRPTDPNPRRSSPTYNLALPTDDDPSGREGRVESFPKEQDSFFAKLLQTRQQWDYNTVDRLFHWSRAVKEEQEYLSNHPKNQAAAREAHRDRMKRLYEKVQKLSGPDQASLTEAAGIDLEDAERELVKPSDVAPSPAASNRGLAQPPTKSDSSSKADRPGALAQIQPGPFANPQFRESTRLVNIARVGALVAASDKSPKTKEILTKLEVPVAMRFADATPLDDVLKYIKIAVQGPKQDGIPIYVDPVGLAEVEKTIASPVILDVEGVPLKTTLRVALKQLGLAYCVKDGLLLISSPKGIIQELREAATEEQRDEFDYRGGFP